MNPYVVTTLGGLRLPLWQRLVGSCPEVFRDAQEVYALVHDPRDYHSLWWTTKQGWEVLTQRTPQSVGPATRQLLLNAADRELPVLHLEDDWECSQQPGEPWLELALQVLEQHHEVGQVRLRSIREYLERGNLVAHDAVHWELFSGRRVREIDDGGVIGKVVEGLGTYRVSTQPCQANFPPSLWRPAAIRAAFPDDTCGAEPDPERAAGMRFGRSGWHIAQLWPGVFRHTGAEQSLIHGHTPELHAFSISKHGVEP